MKTNVYKDNWFDRLAINHLSKSVQEATGSQSYHNTLLSIVVISFQWEVLYIKFESFAGVINNKSGYEGLVEAANVAKHKFSPVQQQEVVIQALDKAFPKPILDLVSSLLSRVCFVLSLMSLFWHASQNLFCHSFI